MNFFNSQTYQSDVREVIAENLPWSDISGASVLITGANGLIASFLADCLMARGDIDLYVLCRNEGKARERFSHWIGNARFHLMIQDVTQPIESGTVFDYIIHAASIAHPVGYATEPVNAIKANVAGTINLLDYAVAHKPKKFLFISSSEVYSIQDGTEKYRPNGVSEDDLELSSPNLMYSTSKRAGESICAAYKSRYGIDTVCIRPWYIYGATMISESSKADAQFLKKAVAGENIVMKSAGEQLRSYCYLADCARMLLLVLLRGENGAYNIAGANTATIREFAEAAAKSCGVSIKFEIPDDIEKNAYSKRNAGVCDQARILCVAKASNVVPPQVPLNAGINRTVKILRDTMAMPREEREQQH
jgi:nucleoside-diphosphate-sugar epimerase